MEDDRSLDATDEKHCSSSNGDVEQENMNDLMLSDMVVVDEVLDDSDLEAESAEAEEHGEDDETGTQPNTEVPEGEPNPAPYSSYTPRGRQDKFTSEKFKIEIRGIPKFFGIGQLKRLLNDTLKLDSNKIKPPRGGSRLYVCFRSEESKLQALKVLNGYVWKNHKLSALSAKAAPDPLERKRKLEADKQDGVVASKVLKQTLNYQEKLRLNTVPYSDVPYNAQLETKTTAMKKVLQQMGKQIVKFNPQLDGWLEEQAKKYNGLPCQLKPIRPSPVLTGYRNKCEFTIGLNPDTGNPTVGFRLGSYSQGEVGVYPADGLCHIPEVMVKVAKVLEELVVTSTLPPWHPQTLSGVWQTAMMRINKAEQLMLMLVLQVGDLNEEDRAQLKKNILLFFTEGAGKQFNLYSLYVQCIGRMAKGQPPTRPELLHGEPFFIEELMGVKLRISPTAFFQVNTPATEELYSAVGELASPTPDTTLLDICCGTGSIGLCLAKDCGQVLGVELVQAAVDDAKANAASNGLSHCDFFAGSAENILNASLVRATRPDIVAILDPPRPGVASRVISTIRRCQRIQRLVYMACSPSSVLHNFRDLARPASKTLPGWPFLPVCAIPVDMFPHTPHVELVVLLERIDPSTLPASKSGEAEAKQNNEIKDYINLPMNDAYNKDTPAPPDGT
ncbi:hypothetical protein B566_EDAN005384 [Ephemera danica]|nr:hypothetical protein B566_EDAN005384 [Ephemera danica]